MGELAHSLPWVRDEGELVTELQAGSDAAFDYLVTYYHSSVYNLVYGILSDRADAADVTQEVFLHVFRGIRGFRGGSSLKTWLYRISVRQALNHRRWCWRHHRMQTSIDVEGPEKSPVLELKDGEATPFEQCAALEVQGTVRRALAEVPPVFRSAVILRDLEGLSYEEIADVLEVSVGTVKSRIMRGRRMLKEILDPLLHVRQPEIHGTSNQMASSTAALSSAARSALRRRSKIHFAEHPDPLDVSRAGTSDLAEMHGGRQ